MNPLNGREYANLIVEDVLSVFYHGYDSLPTKLEYLLKADIEMKKFIDNNYIYSKDTFVLDHVKIMYKYFKVKNTKDLLLALLKLTHKRISERARRI